MLELLFAEFCKNLDGKLKCRKKRDFAGDIITMVCRGIALVRKWNLNE